MRSLFRCVLKEALQPVRDVKGKSLARNAAKVYTFYLCEGPYVLLLCCCVVKGTLQTGVGKVEVWLKRLFKNCMYFFV